MNEPKISFSSWPFPSDDVHDSSNQIMSISKFGFLAFAHNSNLSIFAEELGRFTPMLMWRPFKNSTINAIGWYDGNRSFEVSLPVIVIASKDGRLCVFDIRSKSVIASTVRKNDYVTQIRWCPFSSSNFYVGTSSGMFVKYEIVLDELVQFKMIWEVQFFENISIDYICIDEISGERAGIASKNGVVGVIYGINTDKPHHHSDRLTLCGKDDYVTNCSFFPSHTNFVIVVTNKESLLYALEEQCAVSLLNLPDIQSIQISKTFGNRALVVRDNTVELWELEKDSNTRIASIKMTTNLSTTSEIKLVDIIDDKIILMTSKYWLTTVEIRHNKLFVTKRIKLLDSKPNDCSFTNESFAFCTEDGKVMVTRTNNPTFKLQMKWNNKTQKKNAITPKKENQIQDLPIRNNLNKIPQNDLISLILDNNKEDEVEVDEELRGIQDQRNYQRNDLKTNYDNDQRNKQNEVQINQTGQHKSETLIANHNYSTLNEDQNNQRSFKKKTISSWKSTDSSNRIKSFEPPLSRTFDPLPEDNQIMNKSIAVRNRVRSRNEESLKEIISELPTQSYDEKNSTNKPYRKRRLSSSNYESGSPVDSVLSQIAFQASKNIPKDSSFSYSLTKNDDSKFNNTLQGNFGKAQSLEKNIRSYGNNCSFLWSYQVSDHSLTKIVWIHATRLLTWSSSSNDCDLYMIDLKRHCVIQLLHKKGVKLTEVIVQNNKQYFAAVVNHAVVTIFANKLRPQIVESFTAPNGAEISPILFKTPNGIVVLMINKNGSNIFVTHPIDSHKSSLQYAFIKILNYNNKLYGNITSSSVASKGIYLGTVNGFILKVEAITYNIIEICQMKNSVEDIYMGQNKNYICKDSSGNVVIINSEGDTTKLPGCFETIVPLSPFLMIVKLPNISSIDILHVAGPNAFQISFPTVAARNPLMKPRSIWAQNLAKNDPTVDQLPKYGIPLIASFIEAERNKEYTLTQTKLIRSLISKTPALWHRAFRYSLMLRDEKYAINILGYVPPTNPDFFGCAMKRALFGSSGNRSSVESVRAAANGLMAGDFIRDAVDILLIVGDWIAACKMLFHRGKYIEALLIVRVMFDKNHLDFLKEFASALIEKNEMVSYAATVLCEGGFIKEVVNLLEKEGEIEQARALLLSE